MSDEPLTEQNGTGRQPQAGAPTARRRRASVYVAGPIDQVFAVPDWVAQPYRRDRETLVSRLTAEGFAMYAPHRAWAGVNLNRDVCPAVEATNTAALVACDLLIALLPPVIPTNGTYVEIAHAASLGKPVIVVSAEVVDALPPGVVQVGRIEDAVTSAQAFRRAHPPSAESALQRAPVAKDVSIAEIESTGALQPLPVKPLAGQQFLPMRHYDDDAGLDLFVTEQRTVMPGEFVDVPAGVKVELPPGFWALILGRSSTMRKRGLMALPGVIDTGYRGEWFAGVTNVGQHPVTVAVGERLAQFILLPNLTSQYLPVVTEELAPHPRGENGFGSTGGHLEAVNRHGQPVPPEWTIRAGLGSELAQPDSRYIGGA